MTRVRIGSLMLMEDGFIHIVRAVTAGSGRFYMVSCEAVLSFDLDDNGSVVLEPPTCLWCVAVRG